MPLHRCFFLLLTVLTLLAPGSVLAQARRVALLIGNQAYPVGALRFPLQDVATLRSALLGIGFREADVQVLSNADQRAMKRALSAFGDRARGAEVAFLYYSGHGAQARGQNWLIPIGADVRKEADYEIEAVSAQAALSQLQEAAPGLSVVVLDACRDNPSAVTKSGTKGLGRMDAGAGTVLAFATAPNATAADNGVYARLLAVQLRKPGQEILDVFRNTGAEVRAATKGEQAPRVSEVDLPQRYYLAGAAARSAPGTVVSEPVSQGELDLADLQRQAQVHAERERLASATLARMQGDFAQVSAFSGPSALQAQAWERFLAAWPEEKAPGEVGIRLRTQASQRLVQARASGAPPQTVAAARSGLTEAFTVNGVRFKMVDIPRGTFLMGSPESEPDRNPDEKQHAVSVKAFQLGQMEVTQDLWKAVMGPNPSRFSQCGAECPVDNVNWDGAQAFIQRLNQMTGQRFRLPSEAEWEYAARAGTTAAFSTGSTLSSEQANFDGDYTYNGSTKGAYRRTTTPAGSFDANGYGLHDMHGNVWEWVQDCYGPYDRAPNDGSAFEDASCKLRVARGGSWFNAPQRSRSAQRTWDVPGGRVINTGFRLARTVP